MSRLLHLPALRPDQALCSGLSEAYAMTTDHLLLGDDTRRSDERERAVLGLRGHGLMGHFSGEGSLNNVQLGGYPQTADGGVRENGRVSTTQDEMVQQMLM